MRIDNAYSAAPRARARPGGGLSEACRRSRRCRASSSGCSPRTPGCERARPADVAALLATLDVKLDAARRYRLALDTWALRSEIIKEYWASVRYGLDQFLAVREWLTDVRQLAGPSPGALRQLSERVAVAAARAGKGAAAARSRHRAFDAGCRGRHGGSRRRRRGFAAVRSGNMDTAWEASSAAAGSLMMLDQAIAELGGSRTLPSPHVDHSPRHQAASRLRPPDVPGGDCRLDARRASPRAFDRDRRPESQRRRGAAAHDRGAGACRRLPAVR